jgi:hypothetical protein
MLHRSGGNGNETPRALHLSYSFRSLSIKGQDTLPRTAQAATRAAAPVEATRSTDRRGGKGMNIHDFVGEVIDEPVRSNTAIGDVRTLWDTVQKQRLRGQVLRSTTGKTLPYTLLYYIPGLTTYCGMRGTTIITGYMSGCYLFRYRYRGELRAAHVGTHDTLKEWSDKAKDAWKAVANSAHATEIMGFDPLNDVSTRLLQQAHSMGGVQVAGIWEANGAARIAVVANARAHAGKKVLVGIEPAPLRPWTTIRNEPKMA